MVVTVDSVWENDGEYRPWAEGPGLGRTFSPSQNHPRGTAGSSVAAATAGHSPLRERMLVNMHLAGFVPGTQQAYIGAVVALQRHYGIRPDMLSEKQVHAYILWLRDEKRVAKGTFLPAFHGLKFFYYTVMKTDWALFTRLKVRLPKQKRLPVPITWDAGQVLIAAIKRHDYRLCCMFMLALGLRIGDVRNLTVSNVDSGSMIVRVVGKGNKERVLPLPKSLLDDLRVFWVTHRHPTLLFPNREGTAPICEKSLRRAFNSARDAIGLGAEIKPHSLRHGFATHLLQNGVDIRIVQILLGHASICSTEIYTHITVPMQDGLRTLLEKMFKGLTQGGKDRG